MRIIRSPANALAKVATKAIEQDPEFVKSIISTFLYLANFPKNRQIQYVSTWSISLLYRLLKAVHTTPYGEELKFDAPLAISVSVGKYCPFSCAGCYSASNSEEIKDLEYSHSFELVAKSEIPCVIITGGEPLLAPDFCNQLSVLLDAGKSLYISTNLKADSLIDLIKRYPYQITLIVPVWGDEIGHDLLRGKGSFERVKYNANICRDLPCDVLVYAMLQDDEDSSGTLAATSRLATNPNTFDVQIMRKIDNQGADGVQQFEVSRLGAAIASLRGLFRNIRVDIPELRALRRFTSAERLLGFKLPGGCTAGSTRMHLNDQGEAMSCFAFDSGDAPKQPQTVVQDLDEQWRDIQSCATNKGGCACPAETSESARSGASG